MDTARGLLRSPAQGAIWLVLLVLLLLPACAVETQTQSNEALRKEIQGLKGEISALKEKVAQLEAGQKAILDDLQKLAAPPGATAPPQPLSVSQLIRGKDRYLGAQVTVRGQAGPVLMHHKSLILKAPEGMVEVLFGGLPDQKMVQRLTSTPLESPLTVTGMVSLPPKGGGAKLQITAEAVEF
jgi:hypothetical protein